MKPSTEETQEQRQISMRAMTRAGVLVVSAYIAAQILADIGSLKIAWVAGFSIDGGTFIYPFTFTLRDMVHKLLGRAAARTVVVAAAGINLVMAAYFAFLSALPPDPTWALQEAFAGVLTPVWRIVIASIVAEVLSELLDTEVYHLWVTRITRRYQWARVLISNGFSVPMDSLVFCWAAFGGVLPNPVVWSIFWANVLVKGLTTLVGLPGIYLVKEERPL
ncbi:MAG TPA: queuosine precursor transporter [Anaerolineae bacterium]|nr:queuosine precursor transporter [Anaerolineae bacterium]HQK15686.1 queuosine precursor transporter [Anaerolineae bacterium]